MEEHLPYALAAEMEDIYQWTVDFFGIQKGDNFTVIYDERFIDDSISAGIGRIVDQVVQVGGIERILVDEDGVFMPGADVAQRKSLSRLCRACRP